ncbi:HU family DNA-binding protein [Mycoplasmopsis bovis]|uniref:HU family DNA-binding protein n=1 Tax=Mycoplasmopsis bovis TaxID=28903 RepID=UPI003D2A3EDF
MQLSSFGIFETRIRRGRDTINPFTMNELSVPEKRVIKFTPSKYLRELVNF